MRSYAGRIAYRLPSSFRQRFSSPLSQAARPNCVDLVRRPWRVAHEKTMLHLGDHLTGDFQLRRHAIEAVGMQPDDGLGDHGGGVELVGNRDPVLAFEATFGEPGAHFPPNARLVGALTLDAPAEPGSTMAPGIVVDADDPQVLEPAAR